MRVEKKSGKEERFILTGMITNSQVLGRISNVYEDKLFQSQWASLVAKWCIRHYQKYSKAPGKDIESVYERWANRKQIDKSTKDIVAKFLGALSDEYDSGDEVNVDYIIDLAAQHFNKVKLQRLFDTGKDILESGDYDRARDRVESYRSVDLGMEELTNPYQSMEVHERSFHRERECLVHYPGPLGRFIGDRLSRGDFFVFQGVEKRGKSFWLLDVVHRALQGRKKVAYFQIGDMSEEDVAERQQIRLCGRPLQAGEYFYPKSLKRKPKGRYFIRHVRKKCSRGLTLKDIQKAQQRFNEEYLRSKKDYLQQLVAPTMSLEDIKSRLTRLQNTKNWVPDVIVLDYADLLEPPRGIREKRDQINENWKGLRRLALTNHCLVVTATQANAAAYKKETQDRSNFSDNKLKLAHVTAMLALNANEKEEAKGIMRLNWVVTRRGKSRSGYCLYVASCLDVGNPAVLSC